MITNDIKTFRVQILKFKPKPDKTKDSLRKALNEGNTALLASPSPRKTLFVHYDPFSAEHISGPLDIYICIAKDLWLSYNLNYSVGSRSTNVIHLVCINH